MTEAERYEGKLAKPKSQKRNPQQEWMDLVIEAVDNAPDHLKSYMRAMSGLDNIPRKEKQFRNFTSNSLNLRGANESIVGEIWCVLSAERGRRQSEKEKQQKEEKSIQEKMEQKGAETNNRLGENSQSRKESQQENPQATSKSKIELDIDPKAMQKAMKKALKKAPNRSMKLKELRKHLGEKLGLSKKAKKHLMKLLETTPESCKIKVDGKMIMLV